MAATSVIRNTSGNSATEVAGKLVPPFHHQEHHCKQEGAQAECFDRNSAPESDHRPSPSSTNRYGMQHDPHAERRPAPRVKTLCFGAATPAWNAAGPRRRTGRQALAKKLVSVVPIGPYLLTMLSGLLRRNVTDRKADIPSIQARKSRKLLRPERSALVTGGTRGIGRAISPDVAARGRASRHLRPHLKSALSAAFRT